MIWMRLRKSKRRKILMPHSSPLPRSADRWQRGLAKSHLSNPTWRRFTGKTSFRRALKSWRTIDSRFSRPRVSPHSIKSYPNSSMQSRCERTLFRCVWPISYTCNTIKITGSKFKTSDKRTGNEVWSSTKRVQHFYRTIPPYRILQ